MDGYEWFDPDLAAGVAALQVKWWAPEHTEIQSYLDQWRWRMEGFYECRNTDARISSLEQIKQLWPRL